MNKKVGGQYGVQKRVGYSSREKLKLTLADTHIHSLDRKIKIICLDIHWPGWNNTQNYCSDFWLAMHLLVRLLKLQKNPNVRKAQPWLYIKGRESYSLEGCISPHTQVIICELFYSKPVCLTPITKGHWLKPGHRQHCRWFTRVKVFSWGFLVKSYLDVWLLSSVKQLHHFCVIPPIWMKFLLLFFHLR